MHSLVNHLLSVLWGLRRRRWGLRGAKYSPNHFQLQRARYSNNATDRRTANRQLARQKCDNDTSHTVDVLEHERELVGAPRSRFRLFFKVRLHQFDDPLPDVKTLTVQSRVVGEEIAGIAGIIAGSRWGHGRQ